MYGTAQITYSYEGHGHELRNDQAALDYCFMLPFSDDNRLFHVDALASTAASSEVTSSPLKHRASHWLATSSIGGNLAIL